MKISVIIPIFNAEKYMCKAIESALSQPETGEILLIEDVSPDNSLKICQKLEKKHEKVRLLRHDDLQNHGAGASRNLGIKNAQFDFIAFLDADDYYLENRFVKSRELFDLNPDIDGVYEMVGVDFLSTSNRVKRLAKGIKAQVSIMEVVSSNDLFEALVKGGKGTIHLNGLTVKKSIFNHCGLFYEHLKLHQDTALLVQMSVSGKLISGHLDAPVAMRTIHEENRILNQHDKRYNRYLYWETLFHWGMEKDLSNRRLITLFYRYIFSMYALAKNNSKLFPRNYKGLKPLLVEPLKHPVLFLAAASRSAYEQLIH